jgi:hypothetical protein
MKTFESKLIVTGILFLLTIVSGVWLSKTGKPYKMGVVTAHRLISIATLVVAALAVFQIQKGIALNAMSIVLICVSAILFIALIVSGGILTRPDTETIQPVLLLHRVLPVITLLISAFTFYHLKKMV